MTESAREIPGAPGPPPPQPEAATPTTPAVSAVVPPEDIYLPEDNQEYSPQWARPVRFIALVFLIVAAVYGVTLLAPVFVTLVLSFLLAFVLYKPANFMYRRLPLPWVFCVSVTYVVVIFVIGVVMSSLVPRITQELSNLASTTTVAFNDIRERARNYDPETDGVLQIFDFEVDVNFALQPIADLIISFDEAADAENATANILFPPPPGIDPEEAIRTPRRIDAGALDIRSLLEGAWNVFGTVTGVLTSVTNLFLTTILMLFLSFLILTDIRNMGTAILKRVPPPYHREASLLGRRINMVWNGFFKGQVLIGLVIGILTWLQLQLMGVSGAIILAIITGVISLIPTLGGLLALIPLFFIPLLTGSSVFVEMPAGTFALLVVIINLVITQIIWSVVAPLILGDVLDLPMVVVIVGVFVGAAVGGILGAFLVAPVVSTIRIVVEYLLAKIAAQDPFPGEGSELVPVWHGTDS